MGISQIRIAELAWLRLLQMMSVGSRARRTRSTPAPTATPRAGMPKQPGAGIGHPRKRAKPAPATAPASAPAAAPNIAPPPRDSVPRACAPAAPGTTPMTENRSAPAPTAMAASG
eukprot:scaffold12168_cov86-Isochrysis_galbana.AAC.1